MRGSYAKKMRTQIKKLEFFPDKLYVLQAIRNVILEIKTSGKSVFLVKGKKLTTKR